MRPQNLEVGDLICEKNIIMLLFKKKNILYQYHLKVINAFNSLREGAQRKKYSDETAIKKLEDKHRKYIKRYGCRYILDLYHPHITVARFEDEEECQKALKKYKNIFDGKTTKLQSLQITKDDYETSNMKQLIFDQKLR